MCFIPYAFCERALLITLIGLVHIGVNVLSDHQQCSGGNGSWPCTRTMFWTYFYANGILFSAPYCVLLAT